MSKKLSPKAEAILATLATQWLECKAREQKASKERLEVENKIISITGNKEEGAETTNITGFKIAVTGKLNRKMDWEKWEEVKCQIPDEIHPVKESPELDEAGVKWLFENKKEMYKILPLTITPAKTAVKVEATVETAE